MKHLCVILLVVLMASGAAYLATTDGTKKAPAATPPSMPDISVWVEGVDGTLLGVDLIQPTLIVVDKETAMFTRCGTTTTRTGLARWKAITAVKNHFDNTLLGSWIVTTDGTFVFSTLGGPSYLIAVDRGRPCLVEVAELEVAGVPGAGWEPRREK